MIPELPWWAWILIGWCVLAVVVAVALGKRVSYVDAQCGRPTCGHTRDSHRHYREGDDCGLCPCPHFHPALALVTVAA